MSQNTLNFILMHGKRLKPINKLYDSRVWHGWIMSKFCKIILLSLCLFNGFWAFAQKTESDSMKQMLSEKLADTTRIMLLRDLSYAMHKYEPDSALYFANSGLQLAINTGYLKGQAKNYEMIAIISTHIGEYNKALNFYLKALKIEEKRSSYNGIASAYNNIGIVNMYMKDYRAALESYMKANELIAEHKILDMEYSVALNIGDIYERMNFLDSSLSYYTLSLQLAGENKAFRAYSMLGLGNVSRLKGNYQLALSNYHYTLATVQQLNDDDMLCETTLSIAKSFRKLNLKDSALYYGRWSLMKGRQHNFLSRQYDACNFLSELFSGFNNFDSAYVHLTEANVIKDSLQSLDKIKVTQQIKFNETIRQNEIKEQERKDLITRKSQLQHILIGLFIPTLFLATILLARARIKVSRIKFLGVIALLFLFEYLTLLLHPVIKEITHHTPIYEILIFVGIAAILIPAHHKIEHWFIETLVNRIRGESPIQVKEAVKGPDKATENNITNHHKPNLAKRKKRH